jgi:hypothetical protein
MLMLNRIPQSQEISRNQSDFMLVDFCPKTQGNYRHAENRSWNFEKEKWLGYQVIES